MQKQKEAMIMVRTLLVTLILSFTFATSQAMAAEKTLRVAAAADLRYAMEALEKDFQASHPGLKLDVVYGSSGQFTQQILVGANYDLFLSADASYPAMLKEKNKISGDAFQYGAGRLVIWTNSDLKIKLDEKQGLKTLLQASIKKIAIANPDHAPYGKAAERALKKDGLYDQLKNKFVLGENVAQAAQFAQSKAAQVGLIAYALALSPELKKDGTFILVTSAEPLLQTGVVLAQSKNLKDAQALRDYLMSREGQAILSHFGFKKD
jgi:molybdate transport system substrate-binding protein